MEGSKFATEEFQVPDVRRKLTGKTSVREKIGKSHCDELRCYEEEKGGREVEECFLWFGGVWCCGSKQNFKR